jgi:hypothetical protein
VQLEVLNTNTRLEQDPLLSAGRGVGLANTRARLGQLYGSRQQLRLVKLEPIGPAPKSPFLSVRIPFRSHRHRHEHPCFDRRRFWLRGREEPGSDGVHLNLEVGNVSFTSLDGQGVSHASPSSNCTRAMDEA